MSAQEDNMVIKQLLVGYFSACGTILLIGYLFF